MLDAVAERKEIRKPAKHYEGGGREERRGEKERETGMRQTVRRDA